MHPFYETLESFGLGANSFVKTLGRWDARQLFNFVDTILPQAEAMQQKETVDVGYIANGPLSGNRSSCGSPTCRRRRVDETARFAALYSDTILVHDPLEGLSNVKDASDQVWKELSIVIGLLHHLKPVIEAGLVSFATTQFCLCERHYAEAVHDPDMLDKLDAAHAGLVERYRAETEIYVLPSKINPGGWDYRINGPEVIVEHGQTYFLAHEIPDSLRQKVGDADEYRLTHEDVEEFAQLQRLASGVVHDVATQNMYALRGYRYLTDREIDLEILNAVNDAETSVSSQAIIEGLQHCIPVLPEVPLNKLVALRQNEGEAFVVYRDAVNEVLGTLADEGSVTPERVEQAFKDQIRPELHNIDNTLRTSRRLLVDSLRQDLVFGAGFVTVGLFSGLLTHEIGQVFAGLGGFKYASGILDKANQLLKEPKAIRDNRYYFLWKVRRTG